MKQVLVGVKGHLLSIRQLGEGCKCGALFFTSFLGFAEV